MNLGQPSSAVGSGSVCRVTATLACVHITCAGLFTRAIAPVSTGLLLFDDRCRARHASQTTNHRLTQLGTRVKAEISVTHSKQTMGVCAARYTFASGDNQTRDAKTVMRASATFASTRHSLPSRKWSNSLKRKGGSSFYPSLPSRPSSPLAASTFSLFDENREPHHSCASLQATARAATMHCRVLRQEAGSPVPRPRWRKTVESRRLWTLKNS
jgi:hypothetical protein